MIICALPSLFPLPFSFDFPPPQLGSDEYDGNIAQIDRNLLKLVSDRERYGLDNSSFATVNYQL